MERHHIFWPRRAYRKSGLAWKFRNLKCHIVPLTHEEHLEIHHQRRASEMPSREEMLQKLELCKDCKGDCNARLREVEVHLSEM